MSASNHRSHGWNDDDATPDWPPLETAEVEALLSGFAALRGPSRILWRSPRPFSAAARVLTPAGERFVKRHHRRVRTPAALAEEHAFIAHLRAQGLPVPEVVADDAGRTAIERGDWTYEVHATAGGVDLYQDTPSWTPLAQPTHARNAGRMLARLHRAAAGFAAPSRSTAMLVARDDVLRATDLVQAIDAQRAQRPALAAYFAERRDWRADLAPLAARHRQLQPRIAALPRLWTHGDWHASNLFWTGADDRAEVATILDFGLCAPTFALYDLATAIERNAIAWLHLYADTQVAFPDTARALMAGYAELLPLAPALRETLAALLPLVHVDFALSEVDYFLGVLNAPAQADLAWDGFLLGHAAWFETAPGRALLDAIATPG
jgi:Ser/Thr protein kinase RdoA (MazF antagonist)